MNLVVIMIAERLGKALPNKTFRMIGMQNLMPMTVSILLLVSK